MDLKNIRYRYRNAWIAGLFIIFLTCSFILLPAMAADTPTELGIFPAKSDVSNLAFANAATGAYYYKFNQVGGGGINALHISSNPDQLPNYGDVSTTTYQSGTLYITDTGGRGYQDEAILLVSVMGDIPDNFAIHIKSSGYSWTPTGEKDTPPTLPQITYHEGAVDQTFTKSQFVYGPQTWRPAGNNVPSDYPIYYTQDTTDATRKFKLMFVDLKAGPLGPNSKIDRPDAIDVSVLNNNGAIKVDYKIENLDKVVCFNVYAWNDNTTQGHGISWSNGLTSGGSVPSAVSGFTVLGPEYADRASEFPSLGSSLPVFHGPQTNFTTNVTEGAAPLAVQFTDTTVQSVLASSWDFGDGSSSTERNPVHVYTRAGSYNVSLTDANNQGVTTTRTRANLIVVTGPATGGYTGSSVGGTWTGGYTNATTGFMYQANFTANVTGGVAPLSVQFSDLSGIPGSVTWAWDFTGDGLPESTLKNPVYTFRKIGNYTVNLTVKTEDGGVVSLARPQCIHVIDMPSLDSNEGWIMSDLPEPVAIATIPGDLDPPVPARNATGSVAKVTGGGESPLGTKIAGLLLDAVFITLVIGVGLFLWKKKDAALGEPAALVSPPENEDSRQ